MSVCLSFFIPQSKQSKVYITHVSLVQMCNDTLERLKLTPRPAEGDARPVRYVGFLDAPGMPTHFVRLELAPDADPAFVAASLP